jgi:Na+/proline symporter
MIFSESGGRINFFDFDTNPFIRQSTFSIVIGTFSHFCMQYCIDQQMVQRFMAAKSKRTAQIALLLNIPGILMLLSICCVTGLVIFANFSQCDPLSNGQVKHPNQILPFFVSNKLNGIKGSTGLFLAAVLAAALSSVSSTLNSLASILWQDVLTRWKYFKSLNDSQSTFTTKILVILCGTLCTSLALLFVNVSSNIMQISGTINGAFTAPIIGLFILGSLVSFSNIPGAFIGTSAGLIVSIWLSLGTYLAKPKYPKLGVSLECCNSSVLIACNGVYFKENSSILFQQNSKLKEVSNLIRFDKIYAISYHWISLIPIIITLIVGIVISILTNGCKQKVDKKYMLFNKSNSKIEEENYELERK